MCSVEKTNIVVLFKSITTAITFLIAVGCNFQSKPIEPHPKLSHVCELFETSEEILTFNLGKDASSINGPQLSLPREYFPPFKRGRYRNKTLDGAALFYVRLKDFGPLTKIEKQNSLKKSPRIHASILLTSDLDLDKIFTAHTTGEINKRHNHDFKSMKLNENGLVYYGKSIGKGYAANDIYLNANNNQISDLFFCATHNPNYKASAVRSCKYYINYKDVNVKFTFDLAHLHQWHTYREYILELMSCATKANISSN